MDPSDAKASYVDTRVRDYLSEFVEEPPLLARLRAETAPLPNAVMQITPAQGQLFRVLVHALGVRRALEIGVFTGYSSLTVAMELPSGGELVACDISREYTATAERYWTEAGVRDRIRLIIGRAADSLRTLLDEGGQGSFDFAFIDADKPSYPEYFELTLALLRTGGTIAIDNVLQSGRVLDPEPSSDNARIIAAFNKQIVADTRVLTTTLPIADGLTLAVKL